MTVDQILKELKEFGNEQTKKIFMKHGAKEPYFGVKVQDLKKIQKRIKKNHELSLKLYDSGNGDAMYLAGLIADETKMTKKILDKWAKDATWYMISEYTVPWIAADSGLAWECAMDWIESKEDKIATSGWASLSSQLTICNNDQLDFSAIEKLMQRIEKNIQSSPNRVKYTMNGYLIAIGCYIPSLSEKAQNIADKIGKVDVEMGGTACKVPDARSYIQKVIDKGRQGKKKKMARC